VEKLMRCAQQSGPAWRITVAKHFDPAALFERTYDLGRNGHAAYVFDIATRDGLPPRDDGQRFKHCTRIFGRSHRIEAAEITLHFRPALEPPASGNLDEFEAAALPVELQQPQQATKVVGTDLFCTEELAQVSQGHGLICA